MTKAQGPRPEACQCRRNNGPKCAGQTGPNKELDEGDSSSLDPLSVCSVGDGAALPLAVIVFILGPLALPSLACTRLKNIL